MKDHALFKGEMITKLQKCINEIQKSSSEPLSQFQQNFASKHPWKKGTQDRSNEGSFPFPGGGGADVYIIPLVARISFEVSQTYFEMKFLNSNLSKFFIPPINGWDIADTELNTYYSINQSKARDEKFIEIEPLKYDIGPSLL